MIQAIDQVQLAIRVGGWFKTGSVKVHIGIEPDFRPAQNAHPAFLVAALDPVIAVLRNGDWDVKPDCELPDYRRIFNKDPFANPIELLQRL
jgi:hypothetical protein